MSPPSTWEGLYRIKTTREEITVRAFEITDSTVVVNRLAGSDKEYGRREVPFAIPLADVRSVSKLEVSEGRTMLAIVGVLVLVGAIIMLTAPLEMGSN